ncbi:hypothetical protein KAR91_13965 [Candidatus Pacearchaeota archaeon]|nr:hypothetical protein [Candidatus Pacearchaeota archaeon]
MEPSKYVCPICQSRALKFTHPVNAYYCPECGIVTGQPIPCYSVGNLGVTLVYTAPEFATPDYTQTVEPAYERRTEDQLTINWLIYSVNHEYDTGIRYAAIEPGLPPLERIKWARQVFLNK